MQNNQNLMIYSDGELELKVSTDGETIWLNQKQLIELFGGTKQNISLHINNIYKEKELDKASTIKKYLTVQKEGNRMVERNLEHYNLDMILSLGYRINSYKATKFRQWATSVLKNYIYNGYAINQHKITEQRLFALENDMQLIKSKIRDSSLKITQDIFYNGQIYDAYNFINDLLQSAKNEAILIDNYIDDSVFTLFSKYPNIDFIIYTNTITKQLQLDYEKYQKQYSNTTLKTFKNSHDRFLIIDKKELYHIGASLKDLGKKWFAFSKINIDITEILEKLQ